MDWSKKRTKRGLVGTAKHSFISSLEMNIKALLFITMVRYIVKQSTLFACWRNTDDSLYLHSKFEGVSFSQAFSCGTTVSEREEVVRLALMTRVNAAMAHLRQVSTRIRRAPTTVLNASDTRRSGDQHM
jgi:hypothetical protein